MVAETFGHLPTRALFKTGASLAFLAYAWGLGAWSASVSGQWVIVALLLSIVGDVALLSARERIFLGGLVAFLLGHVAYIVAFVLLGLSAEALLVALVLVFMIALPVWRWLRGHVGSMRGPVLAYIAVISVMVACALSCWWLRHGLTGAGPSVLLLAAALFFVSDLCVARDRFVIPGPANRWIGLPLYYAAQLLFGLGITL